MTKNSNRKNMKFLTSNWVITLTATLIGVFGALYLNEIVASKKIRNQKSIATRNITAEISSNAEKIKKTTKQHIEFLDIVKFMNNYLDEENETFITPVDSMAKFQLKHPNALIIKDSTLISDGVYDYDGELNFNFNMPQLEVTTIAWSTLKNSGISTSYAFECLMYLEGLYNITAEILTKNEELMNSLGDSQSADEMFENLEENLNFLIDFEQSLMKVYDVSEKELKNCN